MRKGIYIIKNKVNNKIYIGVASSSFEKRQREHINDLRNNTHVNKHLQRAWNEYGEDNFGFFILKKIEDTRKKISKSVAIDFINKNSNVFNNFIETRDLLIKDIESKEEYNKIHLLETYYFFKYKSIDINYGYNISKIGGSNLGNTQLTKEQVINIENTIINNNYTKIALKEVQSNLANKYNVSEKMIYAIRDSTHPLSTNYGHKLKINTTSSHFKLNPIEVLEIEQKIINNTIGLKETYYKLAEEYNVSYNTIIDVKMGRNPFCSNKGRQLNVQKRNAMKENVKYDLEFLNKVKDLLLNKYNTDYIISETGISKSVLSNIRTGKHPLSSEIGGGLNDWLKEVTP